MLRKLLALFNRNRLDQDLRDELEAHLQAKQARLEAEGIPPQEARRQARLALGNTTAWSESARAQWTFPSLESFYQDVVFGLRVLRKDKLFSIVALCTIAIAIGANTAVFSLLNALLWRALPIHAPEQLVRIRVTNVPPTDRQWVNGRERTAKEREQIPFALYERLGKLQLFQGVFGIAGQGTIVADIGGESQQLRMATVTGSYFPVLGITPAAGRLLSPADDVAGGSAEGWGVVISDALWTTRFGRSTSVLGMGLRIEQVPFTIIGVAPASFHGVHPGADPEVYLPLSSLETLYPKWQWRTNTGAWMLQPMARLRQGLTPEQAAAQLAAMSPSLLTEVKPAGMQADDERHFLAMTLDAVPARSGHSFLTQSFGPALWALMAAVAAVLLIAATNLTNLLMARGTARRQEIAVRLALGAPLARIRRQLLVEHAMLATAGAALGVILARWIAAGLLSGAAGDVVLQAPIDARVLLFVAALLAAVVAIAGGAPAWSAVRGAVRIESTRTMARRLPWLRSSLVTVQIALSMALLGGACLLVLSLRSVLGQSIGLDAQHSLFLTPDLFNAGISRERMPAAYERILQRTRALPGIRSAAWTLHMPLSGGLQAFTIEVPSRPDLPAKQRFVFSHQVTDGYFAAAGIPLLTGHDFAPRTAKLRPGCIISRNLAIRLFGSVDKALGQQLKPGSLTWTEVIGVAGDAKFSNIKERDPDTVYTSYWDQQTALGMTLVVNHDGAPEPVVSAVRAILQTETARRPFLRARTLPDNIAVSVKTEKLLASVLTAFAAFALVITLTGLAGLLSYIVQLRRKEIGIRLALGAEPAAVAREQWRHGITLTTAGLLIGALLSYWLKSAIASFLFRPDTDNWILWLSIGGAMLLCASIASWIPARHAARVDPMTVLRLE